MTDRSPSAERIVEWMGSSYRDLRDCPEDVQDILGYALHLAQAGARHLDAKPLKGSLRDVIEIVADAPHETFRCVYTVKFAGVLYVLHVFKKKSTQGIKTPQRDLDLISARLAAARRHFSQHYQR